MNLGDYILIYIKLILLAIPFVLILMTVFWIWGRIRDNYGVIDVGWGIINFGLLWFYYFLSYAQFNGLDSFDFLELLVFNLQHLVGFFQSDFILTLLITIWGLRLSIFLLFTRILPGHPEDKRYNAFRKDYGTKVHRKFFTNVFLFQGFLALVLTAPFVTVYVKALDYNTNFILPLQNLNIAFQDSVELLKILFKERMSLGIMGYLGIFIFFIGIVGESLADYQLSKFLKNPSNKGKVCSVGLWRYSRHPNYFFEWVIWLGMSLVAVEVSWGGFLPAVFMYILLVYFSGIPFAEKSSLQSRGEEYKKYQETTNAFFPWFPKKNSM